jgi:hypothetical protein
MNMNIRTNINININKSMYMNMSMNMSMNLLGGGGHRLQGQCQGEIPLCRRGDLHLTLVKTERTDGG